MEQEVVFLLKATHSIGKLSQRSSDPRHLCATSVGVNSALQVSKSTSKLARKNGKPKRLRNRSECASHYLCRPKNLTMSRAVSKVRVRWPATTMQQPASLITKCSRSVMGVVGHSIQRPWSSTRRCARAAVVAPRATHTRSHRCRHSDPKRSCATFAGASTELRAWRSTWKRARKSGTLSKRRSQRIRGDLVLNHQKTLMKQLQRQRAAIWTSKVTTRLHLTTITIRLWSPAMAAGVHSTQMLSCVTSLSVSRRMVNQCLKLLHRHQDEL